MQEVLYEANPSLLRTRPFGTVLLVILLLAGIVLAIASGPVAGSLGMSPQVVGLAGIAAVVIAFVWLLAWFVATKMDHLVIRPDEIVWSHGLISKQYTEISMSSIRTTRISQTLIQRILDAGDILIFTAGDNPELNVKGLPEPNRIRELIQDKGRA